MLAKDELLKSLTKDLEPVKRLWSLERRYVFWLVGSFLVVVGCMLWTQGFRPGFLNQLTQLQFLLETILGFSPFLLMSLLALRLSVPGVRVSGKWVLLSLLFFTAYIGLLLNGHFLGHSSLDMSMAGKRMGCFNEVLILSWLPIIAMIFLVKRGYVPYSLKLGMMVGLAGASLPMALMQVACMYVPEHILSHHVYGAMIPTVVISFLGYFFMKPKY